MKGKHAASAANGRLNAAREHIDHLTEQLAEAKIRARQVERDAARVPHLLHRIATLEDDIRNDSLLNEAWEKLATAQRMLKGWEGHRRRLYDVALGGWRRFARAAGIPHENIVEQLEAEWPGLILRDKAIPGLAALSEDRRHRLEALRGARWIEPDGTAVIGVPEDMMELLGKVGDAFARGAAS